MSTEDSDFDYESALIACARGEVFAFETLYRRESRWLGGVAYRILRDRELAEEALHDAFLQIWQKAPTFDRNLGSARGWIYTVVRHRALGMARGLGREIAVDDIAALSDIRSEPVHTPATMPPISTNAWKASHPNAGNRFCWPFLMAIRTSRSRVRWKRRWAPSSPGSSAGWPA